MSMHHLDPRQGKSLVEIYHERRGYFPALSQHRLEGLGFFKTEAAALAAARAAAGFGHVAERACDAPFYDYQDEPDDCGRCAWPRDAHTVQS